MAALVEAHDHASWNEAAALLHRIEPTERLCGAEINSVSDLLANGLVEKGRLHLLASVMKSGKRDHPCLVSDSSRTPFTAGEGRGLKLAATQRMRPTVSGVCAAARHPTTR